jgi:hypothetical protein
MSREDGGSDHWLASQAVEVLMLHPPGGSGGSALRGRKTLGIMFEHGASGAASAGISAMPLAWALMAWKQRQARGSPASGASVATYSRV